MNKHYFEGLYFKNQQDNQIISLIPGRSKDSAFVQVINQEESFQAEFPLSAYASLQQNQSVLIGKNQFTPHGITVDIQQPGIELKGELVYQNTTPLKYDIMGPFSLLPMQCRHTVVSLHHTVKGCLVLNGQLYRFDNGNGYIEGDRGTSFPKNYTWLQCNDFSQKCSIMVAIAHIPFMAHSFTGCICTVVYKEKQYRFATYLGVNILENSQHSIVLEQNGFLLSVDIESCPGHSLLAPQNGSMTRTIHESLTTPAHFVLSKNGSVLFDLSSNNASFEYVPCL